MNKYNVKGTLKIKDTNLDNWLRLGPESAWLYWRVFGSLNAYSVDITVGQILDIRGWGDITAYPVPTTDFNVSVPTDTGFSIAFQVATAVFYTTYEKPLYVQPTAHEHIVIPLESRVVVTGAPNVYYAAAFQWRQDDNRINLNGVVTHAIPDTVSGGNWRLDRINSDGTIGNVLVAAANFTAGSHVMTAANAMRGYLYILSTTAGPSPLIGGSDALQLRRFRT